MYSKSISSFIVIFLLISSCKPKNQESVEYDRLKYDTNQIVIFKWDTTISVFPNNLKPISLSQNDLIVIDSFLNDAIDSFNAIISPVLYHAVFNDKFALDSFVINKPIYKFQFFPYKDVNGQRIVSIIGFKDNFPSWRTDIYRGWIHYGMTKMQLNINLSQKSRDNILSGDFG